jgi:RNA polymerase primary sigma factor
MDERGIIGKEFCTVEEAARILGESTGRTQRRVDDWELPLVWQSNERRIPTSAILDLRERLTEGQQRSGMTWTQDQSGPRTTQSRSPDYESSNVPEIREYTAQTVELARVRACDELGVPLQDLVYEIRDPGPPRPGPSKDKSATIAVLVRSPNHMPPARATSIEDFSEATADSRDTDMEVTYPPPKKVEEPKTQQKTFADIPTDRAGEMREAGGYYYSRAQATMLTRLSVHRLIDSGKLSTVQVDGRTWIPEEAIDDLALRYPRKRIGKAPRPTFISASRVAESVKKTETALSETTEKQPDSPTNAEEDVRLQEPPGRVLVGEEDGTAETSAPDSVPTPDATQMVLEDLARRLGAVETLLEEERERGRQRDELIASLLAKLQGVEVTGSYTEASPQPSTFPAIPVSPASRDVIQGKTLSLYPWQREALDWWQDREYRGVVEAVTGAGKTRLAVAAIEQQLRRDEPAVVIVPTKDLLRQWKRELERWLVGELGMRISVGLLGDNHKDTLDDHDVVVATAHSGSRCSLLQSGSRGLLVADEAHHYGARSWSRVLQGAFDRRLGLTATYEREDSGVQKVLDPYFGRSVFRVDYERALADDVIAPFKIAFVAVKFSPGERLRYEEYDKRASRYRKKLVRDYGLTEEPFGEFMREVNHLALGGEGEATGLARGYLNAFSKRRQTLAGARGKFARVGELSAAVRKADRSILFAQTKDAAADAVAQLARCGVNGAVLTSGMDMSERKQVFAAFEDGDHELVAAPRLLDEGVDVPAADLAIVLASSRSRRQMVQRMGRVVRKKQDGRLARLVVMYVLGSSEDPEVAHEDFLYLVTKVARDIVYFGPKATPEQICDYLNDWRP